MPRGLLSAALLGDPSPAGDWFGVAAPSAGGSRPLRAAVPAAGWAPWGALDAGWPAAGPKLRAGARARRAALFTAFDVKCLCQVAGECAQGAECPAGKHLNPEACDRTVEVDYPADPKAVECAEEIKKCEEQKWDSLKTKEQCQEDCDKDFDKCVEQCKEGDEDCKKDCKPKKECKECKNCVDIHSDGCTSKIAMDKDLGLRAKFRRVRVLKIRDHAAAFERGVRKGSNLIEVDGKKDGAWRDGGGEECDNQEREEVTGDCRNKSQFVLDKLDWSEGHKFLFTVPEKSCQQGSVCCATGADSSRSADDQIVRCHHREICKGQEGCDEIRNDVCNFAAKYEVDERWDPQRVLDES